VSANIRESEISDVVALLADFAAVDRTTIRKTLTDDEIDVIYQRRRDVLRTALQNKGINVKPDAAALSIVASNG
jgi:hypothetical protein